MVHQSGYGYRQQGRLLLFGELQSCSKFPPLGPPSKWGSLGESTEQYQYGCTHTRHIWSEEGLVHDVLQGRPRYVSIQKYGWRSHTFQATLSRHV